MLLPLHFNTMNMDPREKNSLEPKLCFQPIKLLEFEFFVVSGPLMYFTVYVILKPKGPRISGPYVR
jgi:hypothetical protein